MKPIQRLEQLYKQQIKSEFTPKYKKQRAIYLTSREFCLSCELVTFQEVEQMEYEVNNELFDIIK